MLFTSTNVMSDSTIGWSLVLVGGLWVVAAMLCEGSVNVNVVEGLNVFPSLLEFVLWKQYAAPVACAISFLYILELNLYQKLSPVLVTEN